MTVAMSDCEYGVLAEAVAWIELHAGNDAPEYPQLARLSDVVNSIARRREPDRSQHWRPVSPVDGLIIDLRPTTGPTATYEVEETGAEPVELRCRRCGRTWRMIGGRS